MKFFAGKIFSSLMRAPERVAGFWMGIPRHIRITLGVVAPVAVLALIAPASEAHALFGLDDILYYAIGKVAFGVAWILSFLGGIIIAVEAWLVEVVLNMSTQVVNSTAVKAGFPIALAVTNMGFVAAVIVIAIATILRYGDYVVKKTLPKLIAAALLVNFSLVFAGAILNFADQFTLYFLRQINPTSDESAGIVAFSSALAGAFNPQRNFIMPSLDDSSWSNSSVTALEGAASDAGKDLGKLLVPLTSVSFTLFTLIAIILTLLALVALLLIRYVYLVVLLIVMPFVWLMWIFPGTKSYFSDWWKKFLKQVFFAPVVVFFLYLAILVAGNVSNITNPATGTATASSAANGFSQFLGGFLTVPIQNLMNSLVIVGLMLGGMFAASKIGAAGASAAQKAVMAGTAAIGMGMHAKAGGAVARFRTQGPKALPQRPIAPERSLMGRMLHPIETLKHGAAVASWQAKKTVKPITDPIREKVGGKFEKRMTPETKFQNLAKMNSGQLGSLGYSRYYVDQMAAKEREANLKIGQKKVWGAIARFGENQRSAKMGSLMFGTAWGLMKNTFMEGIQDMGKGGGHISLKKLGEILHLHDDHDDHGKDGSHAGGEAPH